MFLFKVLLLASMLNKNASRAVNISRSVTVRSCRAQLANSQSVARKFADSQIFEENRGIGGNSRIILDPMVGTLYLSCAQYRCA